MRPPKVALPLMDVTLTVGDKVRKGSVGLGRSGSDCCTCCVVGLYSIPESRVVLDTLGVELGAASVIGEEVDDPRMIGAGLGEYAFDPLGDSL